MARYHEVSSLFTQPPTNEYIASVLYDSGSSYYPDIFKNSKKHFWYIAAEPPTHPLGIRFDKLIKYVARLTNNPNPQKIKRDFLKLLNKGITPPEDFHDFFHLILGQSLEIFLKKKKYTIEEYIYEIIAVIIEDGIYKGSRVVTTMLNRAMPEFINNNTVSLKKIYYKELKIAKSYLKKHNRLTKENYLLFKRSLLKSQWFNKFHFFIFLNLYDINPKYPLAVNFKNEVLRELPNVIPPEEYRDYYEKFYSSIEYIYETFKFYEKRQLYDPQKLKEELHRKFSEFRFEIDFIRELLSRIEVFPDETKEIVRKFITYMHAVLDRYLSVKKRKEKRMKR